MKWQEKLQEWQNFVALDLDLQNELEQVSKQSDLEDRFYRYLEFGTGGMRGELGAGTNRINNYTIKRIALGLARYIKENGPNACQSGVVISYDNRHKSAEFAEWTARILASCGIKVFLSDMLRPTPELSYLVRHYRAFAGVMITASHNPKQYNGFKVYGSDGGQITLKTAKRLMDILENITNELQITAKSRSYFEKNEMITVFSEDADQGYIEELKNVIQNKQLVSKEGKNLAIIYTPLHGTGKVLIKKAFATFGFDNLRLVLAQQEPDPDFSTVVSPNPEDSAAFTLALQEAKQNAADILIATDPDADRLGVVVFQNSQPVYLNGNQIGVLLLDYLMQQKSPTDLANYFLAKTIVTSDLGTKMAEKHGLQVRNTLTGFKFIGEQIELSEQKRDKKFLFGYEESFGYLISPFVRDKDAIQAATLLAEVALVLKLAGYSLIDRLEEIYQTYGYFVEDLETKVFLGKDGITKMAQLVENLRQKEVTQLAGESIVYKEDYGLGMQTNLVTHEVVELTLPQSNVIKLILADESWVCVRPSGTEPKFKIYYSVNAPSKQAADEKMQALKNDFNKMLTELSED
ncbi:phosphoglucomutase [Enterococcus saigonensis]|uniref:Phosphoglucomutase n=1 Tax=Enterococcus saigonensis TaxID=1805431 RepID=A0A679IFH5_9ENTE|nr:phospho-sugar mutase [Enterococcus saigonensis]BCA84502.1 phosphoglucomutase [Enterococcus saigonensis]